MLKDKLDTAIKFPRGSILLGVAPRNAGLEIQIDEDQEHGRWVDISGQFLIIAPGDGPYHEILTSLVGEWCTAKELEAHIGKGSKKKHYFTVSQESLVIKEKERVGRWEEYHEKAQAVVYSERDFDPSSIEDSRIKRLASIYRRQGQLEFRQDLIRAYSSRCAVTRCDVIDALEAAHISPYIGRGSNVIANGLLLRADIHTLFDLGLFGIDPSNYSIVLSEGLRASAYREFESEIIALPVDKKHHPFKPNLEVRWREFLQRKQYQ